MSLSFIYPTYLWLLLLVPLTIALALVGRRGPTRGRFWGGLALRTFLLASIVLALAGVQLRLRADTLTAVFVLDVSDSISAAEQQRGEDLIRQAVSAMPAGDKAAIVVFGEDALVERLASEEQRLSSLTSAPVTTRTDIGSALQLALALFPGEGAKRLVLLSDGRENLGAALKQAELAATHQIDLRYVPLGEAAGEVEVLVENLEAPADVRQGEQFDLNVVVRSSAQAAATLRVFAEGDLIHTQEVQLQAGVNRFRVPVDADKTGFRRFRAQVVPDADTRLQNNEASAFAIVHGPPRVLLVEGKPGEGDNLARALTETKMDVVRVAPADIPTTLPELAGFESVILANVHAAALPSGVMDALPIYVRDLGKGLLMTGGQEAFGAGGYLRTPLEKALPVDMSVKNRELAASLALVLAVDKSGSMGRCHCDNPDLNQTYERKEVGQPKVDIAKEAIMRSASALGDQDYLGVVAFDSQARWALDVKPLVDPFTLEQAIGTFQAEGQTNLRTGVEAAYAALENVDAKRKHIILMTDGWVRTGELDSLVKEMADKGITLSVVAAGEGSAEYLQTLAEEGQGRYYPATDILNVPDIFLKETVTSVGQYIIEEPFYPLPSAPSIILRGIDETSLPALLGYNGTTPKSTARKDLITPRGDPLLASWQYGLGRAAVWTSDLKGQWGRDWVAWPDFARFAAQLVGWTLPLPSAEGLSAQASIENGQAAVSLSVQDKEGRPQNFLDVEATVIGPDLTTTKVPLEQVGAGQYRAHLDADQPGAYLIRLGANQGDQSLGQVTLGLVSPYSPEYKASGVDTGLLGELARLTGASGPAADLTNRIESAFLHNLPEADFAREIWRPLLLVAALLFPLDVAVRRVMFGRRDFQKAGAWLRGRLRPAPAAGSPERRALGSLFQARDRARQRTSSRADAPGPGPIVPPGSGSSVTGSEPAARGSGRAPNTSSGYAQPPPPQDTPKPESPPPQAPASSEDSLARLREAKKRARRK